MRNATSIKGFTCQVCEEELLRPLDGFEALPRVTSDCRPFPPGGKLTVCMYCGAVQKVSDTIWLQEIGQIYLDYQAYRIAKGEEQLVLDPTTGLPNKRSSIIMRQLKTAYEFSSHSRVIDIGCGDGVTLKAIAELFPQWTLYGYELDAKKKPLLATIPGFKELFTGDLTAIEQNFNLVTMIHSLEHFVNPLNTLQQLRNTMEENGNIFVQVCNIAENPFDLLVADHLMHFSPSSLANIAGRASFKTSIVNTNWVKKEISFFGSVTEQPIQLSVAASEKIYAKIQAKVNWLANLIDGARSAASVATSFGIFGTSIAASWLAAQLADQVEFFVDEDPNRIGQTYMNKPVFSPVNVPAASSVYLALAPALATRIAQRLQNSSWSLIGMPLL